MKKLIAAISLFIAPALASADGASGCGWGALLFDGNRGVASHVLAATTNNFVFGNNTFGMSSGTNGCTTGQSIRYKGTVRLVTRNMDNLAQDISQGEGEILSALALVLEIEDQDKPTFYSALMHNFETIYPTETVTGEQVITALITVMSEHPVLTKYAKL